MSGQSLRYLQGERFDVTQSDDIIEKLFSATVASLDNRLFIGPQLCRRMLDRQKDHVQNVQDFCDGLRYACMSHFYASSPSIFLKSELRFEDLQREVIEAVRNLPSFRQHVEIKLEQSICSTQEVRKLLESDQELFEDVVRHTSLAQNELSALNHAVYVLFSIREALQMTPKVRASTIWTRAASADLLESPLLRETMLSLKKTPSDRFANVLSTLEDLSNQKKVPVERTHKGDAVFMDVGVIRKQFNSLLGQQDTSTPLRTQHDVRSDSIRTTVVAQKVLLSNQ